MSKDYEGFRSCYFARELHATEDILIDDITGNTHTENIAQSLIEDQLCWGARVDTTQNNREWILSAWSFVDLLQEIAVDFEIVDKSLVSFLEQLDRFDRGQAHLHFLSKCFHDFYF